MKRPFLGVFVCLDSGFVFGYDGFVKRFLRLMCSGWCREREKVAWLSLLPPKISPGCACLERIFLMRLSFSSFVTLALFVCLLAVGMSSTSLQAQQQPNAGASEDGFPPVRRERIEWTRIWLTNADKNDKPRVLLVGDSIVAGHFNAVEKLLGGRANCGHLATASCVCDPAFFDVLDSVLKHYRFEVIVFNNGLHGFDYSLDEYAAGMKRLVAHLKQVQPEAKLVWRNSTPMRVEGKPEQNQTVIERNAAVEKVLAGESIPTIDLYTPMSEHPEYFNKDGVHYGGQGREEQAKMIAETVQGLLGQ